MYDLSDPVQWERWYRQALSEIRTPAAVARMTRAAHLASAERVKQQTEARDPSKPWPSDPTANAYGKGLYSLIALRGD
jgi:hypothetical protein|tara:strand:- start:1383 stop:1616 length:234 start_codon:yes stop_codon:yes gene_type:complete